MKKYILGLLLCAGAQAQAQKPPIEYKTALSFNPSVIIGVDYTAMFGVEHRIKNNLGLVLDAGYLFYSTYFDQSRIKGTSGFSVRPGIRWYHGKQKKEFFQFQVFYKQADYKIYDWLGKDCVDDVPAYEQLQNFTYRKQTVAFNLMAGELYRFSDRLYGELYVGVGVKIKWQAPTEPNSCYRNEDNDVGFNMYRPRSVGPNIPAGFKLIYKLQ
jgi:hypothetical protein